MSSSAPSATRSTRASRSWSTPAAGSSASSAAPPSTQGREVAGEPATAGLAATRLPVAASANGGDPLRMPDGALVAKRDAPVGGQAVLEGVMMRGVSVWAVAVRTPEGQIEISSDTIKPWAQRHRLWRLPVIRGVVALGESMKIGFRALAISANAQLEEDEEGEPEEIGGWVWGLTIAFSMLLAVGLFFVVPVGLTSLIKDQLGSPFLFWLVEGVLRTGDLHRLHRGDQPASRTCGASSSTTAPSTRRSPVTRRKTS